MARTLAVALSLVAAAALADEAPLSLTASDGTGLTLVSYTARAVVEDPLAFTELTLVFENPQARVIEGQFRVTLPRGATVSRFAMKLDGRWQEGEVVEKQAARRAYEDFLHRRQDPALLEQAAGNEFSARVFPIPAKGTKELIISWSNELASESAPYVLPLKGLSQIRALKVEVSSGGTSLASLEKTSFVPDKDVSVLPPRTGRTGVRAGDLVVTRVKAVAASTPEPMPSLLLLVDTSASRALGFHAQVALVQRLVERLAKTTPALPLKVVAFDQTVQVLFDGKAADFTGAPAKALKDRRALGASDLSGALAWVREQGKKAPLPRVVLVTDGVFTAGEIEGDQLLAAVARLKDAGVTRLDAVAVGGIRDEAVLKRLVTAKLPRTGTVLNGDDDPEVLARRLLESTVAKVAVTAEGAKVVWPLALEGVQAGDEAVVVLEGVGDAAVVKVGAVTVDLKKGLVGVEKPLLQRAWAQARIQQLLDLQDRAADGAAQKQKLRDEVIALSEKHRVLSPYTALLVLETEADYARFNIDRRALADILTVEKGRLSLLHRGPEAVVAQVKAPPPSDPAPMKQKNLALKPEKADLSDSKPSADKGGVAEKKMASDESKEEAAPMAKASVARPEPMDPPKPSPAGAPAMRPPSVSASPPPPPPPPSAEASRPSPTSRPTAQPAAIPPQDREMDRAFGSRNREDGPQSNRAPWEGKFKDVMVALQAKQAPKALELATAWREEEPGDVLALVGLGEALEAKGDLDRAARAYGSLIDLFPGRADLRRFAGVRLERLAGGVGLPLAADTFSKAAEQRADHPASHRFLAFALLRLGKPAEAFAALEKGFAQQYPDGRFAGAKRILGEDLGLVAAAWLKAQPGAAPDIRARLARLGVPLEDKPSLRFVLTWETDANDVDFHIYDAKGGHAFYSQRDLPSGGSLYEDVTTGYGPECFTIRLPPEKRAGPYRLQAHYYSRGPMGYGMGKLQLIDHDGKGGLTFEDRPFVVMVDQAFLDLGEAKR